MFGNNHLDQLKRLKNTPVPAESLDRGRIRMQAFMAAHPFMRSVPVSWWKQSFIWKPAAALAMMTVAVGGSGMAVSAAEGSVPGDSLYGVKLLAETVGTQLAFSPEARFRRQVLLSERRLEEADAVLHLDSDTADKRKQRLQVAMAHYGDHIAALNAMASDFADTSDDGQAEVGATVAAHEVERMLERHQHLIDSSSTSADMHDAVLGGGQSELDLEDKVLKAFSDRSDLKDSLLKHGADMRKKLEEMRAKQDEEAISADAAANATVGAEEDDSTHPSHEHVEVEAPEVTIPSVNLPRLNLRGSVHGGLETQTNIESASRH